MSIIRFVWVDEWKFCECGNAEDVLEVIRDYLRLLQKKSDCVTLENNNEDGWKHWTGEIDAFLKTKDGNGPLSLMMFYLLAAHDLTEHGGSVYGAWISDKGRKFLAALEATPKEAWLDAPDEMETMQ